MACIELYATGKNSLKSKDLATFGFQKIPDTPTKPAEAKPSFRKVSLPPEILRMLFNAHRWVREFWPQIYSLSQALDWGQNASYYQNGWGLECRTVNFLEYTVERPGLF